MMESLKSLLEKFENQGKLKKQKAGIDYLNDLLHAADRNFRAAAANVDDFEETAFKAAYDGILQISKVVLLLNGYKTDDGEQHKTTFEVAGAILGSEFRELINKINVYSSHQPQFTCKFKIFIIVKPKIQLLTLEK